VNPDTEISWRTTSIPPIGPGRFGKDHWSTFAYVETRTVDCLGTIAHAHMRCHAGRHPIMRLAKGAGYPMSADGSQYPTLLADGEQPDHDDYDCLDDLIAASLLEVHMPGLVPYNDVEAFVDAYGNPIRDLEGYLINPDYVTGLTELWLCTHATFSLTERGRQVAADLRRHKAEGGRFGTFRMAG
jgi:hypothetical protein